MSSQEFRQMVGSDNLPWVTNNMPWTDSVKEQYFSMLNSEAANQHELEMWRLNNEYNTPEKQMERMIQAGINPAAAYDKVSTGTSSSAPGVHESKTPSWHDTADKLQRINTIMNGVSSIMQSVGSAVGAVGGIQDIALKHQNNWFGSMRSRLAGELLGEVPTIYNEPRGGFTYELYPGAYIDNRIPMYFPELVKGFKSDSYNYELKSLLNERQQGIYDKQMQVNDLLNGLFVELDSSDPDFGKIFRDIVKLISIQSLRRY